MIDTELEEELGKITPLIDIDNYFGTSSKRLMPVILMGVVLCVPCFIYAQIFIRIIPIQAFLVFLSIWTLRWGLIIIGEEPKRLEQYKRQIAEVYSSAQELMLIKTIHADGLIEYMNGTIKYLIVIENGSELDSMVVSSRYHSFIKGISSKYVPDIYIQNIVGETTLESRYKTLKLDTSLRAARDYIKIIDFNVKLENDFSTITRTIFAVKGRKAEFLDMKELIEGEIAASNVNIFKDIHIASKEEVMEIISRDLLLNINFSQLNRDKYKNEDYKGCRVLSFDKEALSILHEDVEEKIENTRGFMVHE